MGTGYKNIIGAGGDGNVLITNIPYYFNVVIVVVVVVYFMTYDP